MTPFVKTRADAPADFFQAEAAGLRWLAEATPAGGARVARVERVAPGRIELDEVPEIRPTVEAARSFGAALARTHAAGADAFGAPPTSWGGRCFIGQRPLPMRQASRWGVFYAEHRVIPYAVVAMRAGTLTAAEFRTVRAACDVIATGVFDDDEPPARLHGDLWNGNVLFGPDGVVLIDPAAHGGHRETDLAMLALFGYPFLDDVLAAYAAATAHGGAPLVAGWQARVPLHQLHPLAVHAAGHGRSYGVALVRAAEATLALV